MVWSLIFLSVVKKSTPYEADDDDDDRDLIN